MQMASHPKPSAKSVAPPLDGCRRAAAIGNPMASGRSATSFWRQLGIRATSARRWSWMSAGLFGQILALVA